MGEKIERRRKAEFKFQRSDTLYLVGSWEIGKTVCKGKKICKGKKFRQDDGRNDRLFFDFQRWRGAGVGKNLDGD